MATSRMGSTLQPPSLNHRRKNGLDTHSSSNIGNSSSTSIDGKASSSSKRPTTPTNAGASRPGGRSVASPGARRESPAKPVQQSPHSPVLGNIILTPSLSDLATGAGKALGGTLGSLGSKLDIAILLAQARHATSAGQHIPPEVESLRGLWRKVDLQIDQLDWEQHGAF
ncbi:hypothetical protein BCR44DRAFT_1225752 [Catenaria anguillulae PL171]|uniref:Uncharacterized protein n=1 Tax=Catenaria anguillulae PL171 TaxID=765915 RepID=A0A1Y2HE69_9FUNG|nr:hypothetical protein BCR44DRAFT_1225752 [Catenaria anguillulae PL171]